MSKHLAPSKHKHLKAPEKTAPEETEKKKASSCSCGCSCGCGHDHNEEPESHKLDIALILASAALFAAALFIPLEGWYRVFLFVVPYLIAGYKVILGAFEKIVHGEFLGEDFLMTVASIGAFCIGEYPEAVMVMLLYRVGALLKAMLLAEAASPLQSLWISDLIKQAL